MHSKKLINSFIKDIRNNRLYEAKEKLSNIVNDKYTNKLHKIAKEIK